MNRVKRVFIPLFFILSLGLMMGQDGACFLVTDNNEDDLFSNTNVIGF